MSPSHDALIRDAVRMFSAAGLEDPTRDSRHLMRWVLGIEAAGLASVLPDPASAETEQRFRSAVDERLRRRPVSHITGVRDFWTQSFRVTSDVLDPRPETEVLVAEALHRGPFRNVLDLGTGSGCLLVTLLAEWPGATGTGTDISPDALAVARQNAATHGVAARAAFHRIDWAAGINGPFDLIVSNPPYLAADEIAGLAPEVRDHEPHIALSPGGDGLDSYRAIAASLKPLLAPQGRVMVEIGPTQSQDVAAIFAAAGLCIMGIIPDLDQRARVITARF